MIGWWNPRAAGGAAMSRYRSLAAWPALLSMALVAPARAQNDRGPVPVRIWQDTLTIPTYEQGSPDPNPPFDLFAAGRINYPYTLLTNLTGHSAPRVWRTLNLENEWLRCTVLPDLGGHLYRCTDKVNGAELFYANPSIKFARIAYRGAWAALGVEFNFPVSHNWMTVSPVDFATTTGSDGSGSIWIGNLDRVTGMQWRVQLTLRPGRSVLEQRTTLYNPSDVRHRFYWWTNAGVEVWDDSRIIYPMRFTAAHGFADVDTWPVNRAGVDLSVVGHHRFGPVSRFSYGSREGWMAVYHPRTRAGVVHYSAPTDLPAKKIWSWGVDADAIDWRRALSDDSSAYVEIQAGLFRDQETYGFLEPEESVSFTEYWLPIRDLGDLVRANPDAALGLERAPSGGGTVALAVAVAVTDTLPNAELRLSDGARQIASERLSLGPGATYAKHHTGLPAGGTYTLTLLDSSGATVLQHTEGRYDYMPAAEVTTGARAPHQYPAPDRRSDGDFVGIGTEQERQGQLLDALATYREGLGRFPESLALRRTAGVLEVGLKQYGAASADLAHVVERVSTDREAWYYAGLAAAEGGDDAAARRALELAQAYGAFRPAATVALAALVARGGDRAEALRILERLGAGDGAATRAGAAEIALLRSRGRADEARDRLAALRRLDPTSSLLRYEGTRLGTDDPSLWEHLAADPERILEIATAYVRFGLCGDAVDLLARQWPTGPGVVSEPGMPRPESYPLIAYYRGFCRYALGRDGGADFAAASRMPTAYVFPSRPESFGVLRRAIAADSGDATAHFLLGSLLMSAGLSDSAMREWERAERLDPRIPTLHGDLARTVLATGGAPERAIALFTEGTRVDSLNVGLYLGLEQAMRLAGRPAEERARALLAYPDRGSVPAVLAFTAAGLLAEAGRFDDAERQLAGRFFSREEGGANVRQVYLGIRLARARALAAQHECARAMRVLDHLADPVSRLPFTQDGMRPLVETAGFQHAVAEVRASCPGSAR
jgi:tetratricopeptide (TPR) repeat protein